MSSRNDQRSGTHPNEAGRGLRLVQAGVAGIALGFLVVGALPPEAYRKDLQVHYLTARALRDGIDVFTPLTELSARYFPAPTDHFAHVSPYPPVLALLSLPLTLLPFSVVVPAWLALNIALLIVVGRWLGLSPQWSLALAAWPPLWCLLFLGQLELLILTLAFLGWRAADAGRDLRAGFWLGLTVAIKLYPALLLLPYLKRRRFRLLAAAAAVVGVAQIGNLIIVGGRGLVFYYHDVLPAVAARYTYLGLNSSPYGALLRLFGGASDVAPLAYVPQIVLPATILISLLAVVALIRLRPQAAPVALLVALPSVWYYYAVWALPQLGTLLRGSRPSLRGAAWLATAAASLVLPLLNQLLGPLSQLLQSVGAKPPPMAILLAIQPAGFVGWLVLSAITKSGRARPESQ